MFDMTGREHLRHSGAPGTGTVGTHSSTPPPPADGDLDAARRLGDWWRDKANAEISMVANKTIEYGSGDLEEIGHAMARVAGRTVSDSEAAEWGCAFYALGKIKRAFSAYERGRRPSDDTWLDLGVYVRMIQRIREAGGWPGHDV